MSSTSNTSRPTTAAGSTTSNAFRKFNRRCREVSPNWLSVSFTRRIAPCAARSRHSGLLLFNSPSAASAIRTAWLYPRHRSLAGNRGTATTTNSFAASPSSISTARANITPNGRARAGMRSNFSNCTISRRPSSYAAYATARSNSGGAIRQGEHRNPSTGNCPAYRTPSISKASPQRRQSVIVCSCTASTHPSQTGDRPALSNGSPQTLQSPGQNVVTKSSTAARTTRPGSLNQRTAACCSATLPGGAPDSLPVTTSSALSFQRWLKTHLTRRRSRSVGPRHGCSISPQARVVYPSHFNNYAPNQVPLVLHLKYA
jgi:hypothetical protein